MAQGTVTYVDGGTIGINVDGAKGDDGKLKTNTTVKIAAKDQTVVSINGDSTNKRVADIVNGDKISTSGPEDAVTRINITRK